MALNNVMYNWFVNPVISLSTLLSGEDPDNNVQVVEQGRFQLKRFNTTATHNLGANGAIGDYIHALIFPRGFPSANAGLVYLRDGGGIVVEFGMSLTGIDMMPGTVVPIQAISETGTWAVQIQNASATEVIAIGRFTD